MKSKLILSALSAILMCSVTESYSAYVAPKRRTAQERKAEFVEVIQELERTIYDRWWNCEGTTNSFYYFFRCHFFFKQHTEREIKYLSNAADHLEPGWRLHTNSPHVNKFFKTLREIGVYQTSEE